MMEPSVAMEAIEPQVCPIEKQKCLPVEPVLRQKFEIYLTFSMIVRYLCFCNCDCQMLDYVNEGILLEKKLGNTSTPVHYYADNNNVAFDTRYFKVSKCYPDSTMTLYSNGADPDITVPCTVTNSEGSILYSVTTEVQDLDQVSFLWQQSFLISPYSGTYGCWMTSLFLLSKMDGCETLFVH
uniref:Uncharacterized protein n=1 Tax=Amphimedon queenslandica TaxID=400682 RepID=A0A1X7T2B9_AMPQE